MIEAVYKNYETYDDFINDVMLTVMFDDHASIICQKTINGKSMSLDLESAYSLDDEIVSAQMNDGNVIITVLNNGTIICEAAIFTDRAICFADGKYFIEYDASSALDYSINGMIIPFIIKKKIKL